MGRLWQILTRRGDVHPRERERILGERAQQIGTMYRLSRTTRYFPFGLLFVLLVVFWDDQPAWVPVGLFVLYVASTYVFDLLRAAYGVRRPEPEKAARWGIYFAIASVGSGMVWGAAGWLYYMPENPASLTFLALFLLGLATSSVVSRAGYLPAFYTFAVSVLGPFVVRAFLDGTAESAGIGLLGLFYFIGIAIWAHSFSHQQRDELALRSENLTLVDQLRGALHEAEAAREAAETADRAKTQFLATISHELRTPLNGILGMTGLLLGTRLDQQQRAFADAVRRSGDSLLGIIDDILDFSKLEADRIVLERIDFDLREVAYGVVELMAPRAHAKGLEIDAYIAADAPDVVLGDPARLRQVLLNLVGNAVKFTAQGSVVVEISRAGERDEVPLVRFDVTDTGIGVPAEALPTLFTRFQQGDASITRRYGGTGLGLAIAKRLVEAMDGEIGVEPRASRGSRFWFIVPLARVAVASDRQLPLAGLRACVVSEGADLGLTARKLRDLGVDVVRSPPDVDAIFATGAMVVVFDVADSGASVVPIATELKRRGDGSLRIVLAVRAGATVTEAALSPGDCFDRRLIKPFRRTALVAVMADMVPQTRSSAPQPPEAGGLNVLVADDIEVNRELLVALLQQLGCHAQAVADGQAALEQAQAGRFDLIFMDLEMPRLHGLAAAAAIRSLPGAAGRVPIIGVTAHIAADHAERCRAAGMDDFLSKPIDPNRLESMLGRWRRSKRLVFDPQETVAGTLAALDPSILEALELRVGRAKAASLVGDFIGDLRRRIDRFSPAARADDRDAMRREGHILKGLAGNFGLLRLADLGDGLVKAARTGDHERAIVLADAVAPAAAEALAQLSERFPELGDETGESNR